MMLQTMSRLLLASAALGLAACGGGGGDGVNFTPAPPENPEPPPPPPPPPPPARTTDFSIVADAPTGELAVVGVRYAETYDDPDPMAELTLQNAELPDIRYDSSTQTYELKMPGGDWSGVYTTSITLPDWARLLESDSGGWVAMRLNFDRSLDADDAQPASSYGRYWAPETEGWLAVGIPTPAASLPLTGSANFDGEVRGSADIMFVDGAWGGLVPADVTGSVTLSFDFSRSTLSGAMGPVIHVMDGPMALPELTFTQTVYANGAYSGRFATDLAGINSFNGFLTGPTGSELIGAWAFPFHYSGDGMDHQAAGVWVAKRD